MRRAPWYPLQCYTPDLLFLPPGEKSTQSGLVGACLATGARIFATGSDSVSKIVLQSCGCFCLISVIQSWIDRALEGQNILRTIAVLRSYLSPLVFTVRSGPVWRQDLAILSRWSDEKVNWKQWSHEFSSCDDMVLFSHFHLQVSSIMVSNSGERWTGSPNESIDQIGKSCPRNVWKLCFQPLWTISWYLSDIFWHFSDILSTFPFFWAVHRFARYKIMVSNSSLFLFFGNWAFQVLSPRFCISDLGWIFLAGRLLGNCRRVSQQILMANFCREFFGLVFAGA